MFTLDYFILSLLIAIGAFVYTNILMGAGEILGEFNAFFYNVFNNEERLIKGDGYHPIYKAFFQCEKCFAGQLAVWTFLILNFDAYTYCGLSFLLILQHVLFTTLTILLASIIKIIYTKINHGN